MAKEKQVEKPKKNDLHGKIKNFDVLKNEYDLSEENLTVGMVLHKMSETMEFYLKLIQQILQPEEFHAIYECVAFSDKEKAELFDLYKKIIIAQREMLKAEIMNDEKTSLSAIQSAHLEIKSVKPKILGIVDKMQESWKVHTKSSTMQYFG